MSDRDPAPGLQVPARCPPPPWGAAAQSMFAAAQAVARAGGPGLFADLVRDLAGILQAATVFVAVFADEGRTQLRTLAAVLDGRSLANFDYPLVGSPCAQVVGRSFRYVASGVAAEFSPGTIFAAKGMDSYAAFPLNDSAGAPIGLLVAMGRTPVADPALAEALLKIFAGRMVAEIERGRTDDALRALRADAEAGQQRAREALERSAANYRAIFEAAEDAIFIHDWESGAILDVNPKASETYGWPREEFTRLTVADFSSGVPPYTAEQALHFLQLARLGRCPPFEWQRRNRDGSLHWDEVRLKPAQIDGRPHVLAFTRDITDRKAALAALQASEQQYRAIFDSSADSMGLWDEGLRLVDVNRAFTRISGWSRDDVIGQRLQDRAGEPETDRRAELIRAALAGDEGRIEVQVPKKDGSRIDVETRYVPVAFGGRRYALSIARDITERKAALEALRSREEQYRAVFESTSDALVLWDRELTVVDVNPAALQLYGYTREEVVGRGYPATQLPDDYVRERQGWVRRALAGETVHVETTARRVRGDGSSFEIELRVVPFRHRGQLHALAIGRDITERKRAEAALRASEAQYRAIFVASADALILWNSQYRRVDVNPAYERMFGFRRDEVVGRGWEHAGDGDGDGDAYAHPRRELVRRALAGEDCRDELVALRKDGSTIQIEVSATPFRHRGEPHVLAIARDITERKRAESALRASEEQYRAVFDASTDALTLWDSRLCRVDVNLAYTRLYGWTRDEVIGRGFEFPPFSDEHQRLRADLVHRALAGETVRAEHDVIGKGGRRRLAEVHAIPFRHHGEPHALVIARDITDRKHAEAALRASEERYRAIFDGSADALLLWDAEPKVVDVNEVYLRWSGYTRQEVLSMQHVRPLERDDLARRLQLLQRALEGHEGLLDTVVRRKDGSQFDIELRYVPVRFGGVPMALAIGRDLRARRAAEAERLQLEAQLQQAQKMEAIGHLTGGIAHDFNNILTSVIGYLVLGQERAQALQDGKLVRQLGQAQLAAQRARELIAQMLAFARRQRGERRAVNLPELVRQSLQLLRPTLPATIVLDTMALDALAADSLPPLHADAVQIEQVLFNLCINARDAMAGNGAIRVRLRERQGLAAPCAGCGNAVQPGRWVELSVADTGSGIAPEVLRRMFEPFFTTKEVGRGSGMGLAMVHGIVHEHGGHVVVDTTPGQGSVFRVLLPASEAGGVAAAQQAAPAADAARLAGLVLLVEDEAMVGDFMAELLEGWGLDVVLLRDPGSALAWLEDGDNRAALLISDQTMPQLTGSALAERVATIRPGLPVLLYTGNPDAVDPRLPGRGNVHAVLPKPVEPDTLRSAIERCLAATG